MNIVLGMGTFGLDVPHGGARRVRALRDAYRAAGIRYIYLAFEGQRHGRHRLEDEFDLPMKPPALPYAWLFSDLIKGAQAMYDRNAFHTVRKLVQRLRPRAVQLEQPFLYPLFDRLRADGCLKDAKLIFSSQNDEGRLRGDMVNAFQLTEPFVRRWADWVGELDRRCLEEANLVLAVSEEEAAILRSRAQGPVVLACNGTTRKAARADRVAFWRTRMNGPFAAIVGSGHAPNIHGFRDLLVEGGMPYLQPRPAIVVCGDMGRRMFSDPLIRSHEAALATRIVVVPEPDDAELASILEASTFIAVPIVYGAGTNIKTAEALAAMKPVLLTPHGARGYDAFLGSPGFAVAARAAEFRQRFAEMLVAPPLKLSEETRAIREQVYWHNTLRNAVSAVSRMIAHGPTAPD